MLVFLDFKATGNELDDKICAVSVLSGEDYFTELINEGKKITPEASAYHHISNQHIKEKGTFLHSKIYQFLQELDDKSVVVVHDYEFIRNLLEPFGVGIAGQIIDTKRIAKHIISDIDRFDLQYLRYELQLSDENEPIYKPLEDVVMIKSLFDYLLESISQEQMFELSFQNVLLQKFSFGKYNGKYIEEIVHSDPQYLHWMLSLENLDADLRYSIEYYLQG
ncbi:exonuclease domain-containing protein [Sulfurimonas sp. C5]|uniref:exodeoxyribonuclease X C-terminal domain-containing protein n=1 Tax=Sulfurimonas sp. C5 TaxID=3036947 RepID=UPI002454C3A9|nr:exonuclease domain-containing protein [Sulfurimonas sp. C5]MDH4945279.1 exonuclease domain-containing protein [Sulfurimonas sp. C5]